MTDIVAQISRLKELALNQTGYPVERPAVFMSVAKAEWLIAHPDKAVPILRYFGCVLPDNATSDDIRAAFGRENGFGLTIDIETGEVAT